MNDYEFYWPGFLNALPALIVFIPLPIVLLFTLYFRTNYPLGKKIIFTPICLIAPFVIAISIPLVLQMSGFVAVTGSDSITYEQASLIFGEASDFVWSGIAAIIVFFIFKHFNDKWKKAKNSWGK